MLVAAAPSKADAAGEAAVNGEERDEEEKNSRSLLSFFKFVRSNSRTSARKLWLVSNAQQYLIGLCVEYVKGEMRQ